jgi:murein L,D-transpeptidase YcbB/YkuD
LSGILNATFRWAAAAAGALMLGLSSAAAEATPSLRADCSDALTRHERDLLWEAIERSDERTEAPGAAFDDATINALVHRYAALQLGQRIRPSEVDQLWAIAPRRRDVAAELQEARSRGKLAEWLKSLEPPHADYRRLESERCRYAMIVDAGGWRALPPGPTLKPGDESEVVLALRGRLGAEGYVLSPVGPEARFDEDLASQVRAFQRRHDLEADGAVGPETRRELDVSAEERLGQIEANLERWRWLPHELPPDRIEVDAGAATAALFLSGRSALEMRAIVGDPGHKTPIFDSQVEAVVFNPPWNVPASIATKEILPKAARDPGYLARNRFVRTVGGLRQEPGPANALGRVKFDLRSPFGVYLHDTPGRAAFDRRSRALSHGCMRLEKARELAALLLGPQGWSPDLIDQTIAAGVTRRVSVQRPLPLYVVYRTASVDPFGWATFRRDHYGWDRKLLMALANASRGAEAGGRLESECSPSPDDPER